LISIYYLISNLLMMQRSLGSGGNAAPDVWSAVAPEEARADDE
jgi:hypothetical protein